MARPVTCSTSLPRRVRRVASSRQPVRGRGVYLCQLRPCQLHRRRTAHQVRIMSGPASSDPVRQLAAPADRAAIQRRGSNQHSGGGPGRYQSVDRTGCAFVVVHGAVHFACRRPDGGTVGAPIAAGRGELPSDGRGSVGAGRARNTLAADYTFDFTVSATVAARNVFYNNSAFDGGDAQARQPTTAHRRRQVGMLPGQVSSTTNVTNFGRGINGLMFDVAGLAAGSALTADDFDFQIEPPAIRPAGLHAAHVGDGPPRRRDQRVRPHHDHLGRWRSRTRGCA